MANDQLRWTVRQQKDALAAAMARIEVLTAALSDTSSRVEAETETEAEADPESDNEMLAADV